MKIISLIVSAAFFITSLVLFSNAQHMVGVEGWAFGLGIISMSLAFFLPIHVFKSRDDA